MKKNIYETQNSESESEDSNFDDECAEFYTKIFDQFVKKINRDTYYQIRREDNN